MSVTVIVLLAVLAVFVAALILVGPFFVKYALARQQFDPSKLNLDVEQTPERIAMLEEALKWGTEKSEKEMITWKEKTPDNLTLDAGLLRNGDTHRYAIAVHGYASDRSTMYIYGKLLLDLGFNVLLPDNRGHGKSDGNYIGMGWPDSRDILLWINRIIKEDPLAEIAVLGVSMGGATVMMLSGLDLPENVKCLIEDCGYSSVWDEFSYELKNVFKLPPFPALYLADVAARLKVGYSIRKASALERLAKAKVPMLFIHGTADTFVPFSMLEKNVEAYGGPYKEVLIVEKAIHADAITRDYNRYYDTVKNFTSRLI